MSLEKSLFSSYLWNALGNFSIRIIGLVSTLILVRLLAPAEFGILAIIVIITGLLALLSEFGLERYLVLKKSQEDDTYNACWTINMVFRAIILLFIYLFNEELATFFNEPRLELALKITCLIEVIGLFKNIGMVKFIIAMNFKVHNKIKISAKVVSVTTTIIAAYYFRDYRALLVGNATLIIVETFLSYKLCDYRPKLCFKLPEGLVSFGSKVILRSISGYTRSKIDILLVGKTLNANDVGKYSISQEFAVLPQQELIEPSIKPLFSALSGNPDKQDILNKTYKFLSLQFIFIFPAIAGVYSTAEHISGLVLGEQWIDAWPVLASLSFLMLPSSLQPVLVNLYDYWGKSLLPIILDIAGIIAMVYVAFVVIPENIEEFAHYRSMLAIAVFLLLFLMARIYLSFSLIAAFNIMLIPLLATLSMLMAFEWLYFDERLNWLAMISNILVGAISYAISCGVLLYLLRNRSPIWQHSYNLILVKGKELVLSKLPIASK